MKFYKLCLEGSKDVISVLERFKKIVKIATVITDSESIDEAVNKIEDDTSMQEKFEQQAGDCMEALSEDNKSARERDMFVNKQHGWNVRANLVLVFICLTLVGCVVALVFFRHNLTSDVVAVISGLTGAFGQCLRDVFHFEFGGSKLNFRRKK